MIEPINIINKVVLEVNTSSQKTAYFIKDNISSFLESELFPRLEVILGKYDFKEPVIRLNEISVDVNLPNWGDTGFLKTEIAGEFQRELQKNLPSGKSARITMGANSFHLQDPSEGSFQKEKQTNAISTLENLQNIFLFFMENGRLPWYAKKEHIREISRDKTWAKTLKNKEFVVKLKMLLESGELSIRRFVLQFPDEMYFPFLKTVNKNLNQAAIENFEKLVKEFLPVTRKLYHQWLMELIVSKKELKKGIHLQKLRHIFSKEKIAPAESVEEFQKGIISTLEQISPGFFQREDWHLLPEPGNEESMAEINISGKTIPENTRNKSDSISDVEKTFQVKEDEDSMLISEDEFFVENAGLILLHPFLKSFFNEFKILNKKSEIINNKKELAVQALHYLTTGSEDFFEGNLLLEKFLCNVPQNWPVLRESLLNEQIKTETGSLLEAAIKNWPALKNTSPDGLRQMFLQRQGKLLQTEKGHKLIVERKAQDILLDKLAWNVSVVKLPWRKELLFVEW